MLMRPMVPPGQAHLYANRNAAVRQVPVMENHKVLYRVEQVFPSRENGGMGATSLGMAYTLRAGSHSYPFKFKIPFNNGCADPQQQAQMGAGGAGFGGFGLGAMQQMQYRHVKKTLPPSLTGFPGEAEIRYYVKVTVQRPSLFKENRRSAIGFRFMPIEPPRAPQSSNEVFARRPFAFQPGAMAFSKKGGMFAKKKEVRLSDSPPKGEVDARLPSPAVLTCNQPLPLRILVKKTTQSPESLYLTNLQVDLIGTTEVRAADVARKEMSHWVLVNYTNMNKELGTINDAVGNEIVIDGAALWANVSLPNTVAPSFGTCNIDRRYEVEVKVGLGYGVGGEIQVCHTVSLVYVRQPQQKNADSFKQPQNITLPLRFPVTINSGITPPAALLDAMASRPTPNPPSTPFRPPAHTNPSASTVRPTPTHDPLYPPQLAPGQQGGEDAPPSYEDAMADQVGVVDGGRREYSGITDVNAPDLEPAGGSGGKRR